MCQVFSFWAGPHAWLILVGNHVDSMKTRQHADLGSNPLSVPY